MINIPKGTKDVLPSESYIWHYVENKIRDITSLFNVKEIRTPVFEHTELFLRGVGEGTDIVKKEMYTFLDKGDRSITLKPEGTAAVARSFIENSLEQTGLPLKVYYITPCFRYERPQAGRLREHHQFGLEFYGDGSPYMDYEAINLAYYFLKSIGIKDVVPQINSIGCNDCRPNYNSALKKYLKGKKLCKICDERIENNPLRVLDCKVLECKIIAENAPSTLECVCEGCKGHFEKLKEILTKCGIKFEVNSKIVRGLDYYNKTVFEFVTNALGAQGTICGGGRYDNLVASLGGKNVSCVGFAIGLERLIMLLKAMDIKIDVPRLEYFLITQNDCVLDYCIDLAAKLRERGIACDMDYSSKSVKSQFKIAERGHAKNVIVIGDDEIKSGKFKIKSQSDGITTEKTLKELFIL
ncbi:MAG: histidine--tRNA ligase [Firmicutes bacterium]|nr:histidine--tRNA ligase [Bacillota bacterium]